MIAGFALIVLVWIWDASVLTRAADANLQVIKLVTALLPAGWASKTESALRMFGADRALLLTEAIVIVKAGLLAAGQLFRRR